MSIRLFTLYCTVEIVEDMESPFETTTTIAPEISSYKALFSTIIAIHQQEYLSVCSKVEKALNKFQTLKTITVELQEAIRLLKNTVSAQGKNIH